MILQLIPEATWQQTGKEHGGNTMEDELQREEINRKKARLEIGQEKGFFIGAPIGATWQVTLA